MKNDYTLTSSNERFHDGCGIGFICERSGKPTRRVMKFTFDALRRMSHRSARSSDNTTSDGVGILTDIPRKFFKNILKDELGFSLKSTQNLVIGMVFNPVGSRKSFEEEIIKLSMSFSMEFIGKRKVPVSTTTLGKIAKDNQPQIFQYIFITKRIRKPKIELNLFLFRKVLENRLEKLNNKSFICSLSSKTIVYKGLMLPDQLDRFYIDLASKYYISRFAIFHERFSTNTESKWAMAQPFRYISHNGEINTIKGNRLWMQTRESEHQTKFWGINSELLTPLISQTGSDSFSLDNVLELLKHSKRSMFQSMMMIIPEYYEKNQDVSAKLRNFYIYHENLMEPWDGPAAVVFSDGDFIGAKLDRNGLRPLRYTITKDGLVVMASEAGAVDISPDNILHLKQLNAGEIFGVSLSNGKIYKNKKIKTINSEKKMYSELISNQFEIISRKNNIEEFQSITTKSIPNEILIAHGYDKEDLTKFLIPMAKSGREPIGSMGDDTPLAAISRMPRRLYNHFKQAFAQVTNPPIDSIREKYVTALFKYLGSEDDLFSKSSGKGAVRIESPVLSPCEMEKLLKIESFLPHDIISCCFDKHGSLKKVMDEINTQSEKSVRNGTKLLILSDEMSGLEKLPIPMPLVVSAVHHHLVEKNIRSKTSLLCYTADLVEDHHLACLIAFGASAVYPYLAYEIIFNEFKEDDYIEYLSNYRFSLEKGLRKIMAKMGISTVSSYHGSMLLHGIGLSQNLIKNYFPSITSHIGGIGLGKIKKDLLKWNTHAIESSSKLVEMGWFRYRKAGEIHGFSPEVFKNIQNEKKNGDIIQHGYSVPVYLRDLMDFRTSSNITQLDEIEKVNEITKRFGSAGMSFGSLSDEVHRTLAKGMALIGGRSNTGEGGELPDRFAPDNPDKTVNSSIKQVASGRFGVTTDYLVFGREIQIKIAQGAKPGEGGQLPGHKVVLQIASARSATPGVPLISPPPHHDIYSIEDIAQLIYDLKQVNPRAAISVKLVSQPGVGIIACGVVKAGADVILISGNDGGTGASPLGSIKHTGFPWELGLAETHQALVKQQLRDRMTLRVDGGLKFGKDIIIAAMLGAEEFDFGTAALISLGCIMARQCHLNTCPTGIATQNETLRRKFNGTPENLANYLISVGEEVRYHLSTLGVYKIDNIIGRTNYLKYHPKYKLFTKENGINLDILFNPNAKNGLPIQSETKFKSITPRRKPHIDETIISEVRNEIATHGHAVSVNNIDNMDRAVGARLSGELAFLYGSGKFKGNILVRTYGIAGQSYGAFLTSGIEMRHKGIANDYVGKGMSGGLISVRLSGKLQDRKKHLSLIGNTALYGATGGTLLASGTGGERFAVRNSGAAAVVEGVGNHCCEYMTRGAVLVLGKIGQNFGAGMSGGIAFIYLNNDKQLKNINFDFVTTTKLHPEDESLVIQLLHKHKFHTVSSVADYLLKHWKKEKLNIVKIKPHAMNSIDLEKIYNQQYTSRKGVLFNE